MHTDLAGWGVAASPVALEQLEAARRRDMDNMSVRSGAGCKLEQNMLLLHAKFGRGVVTGVNGAKVDVLFEDTLREVAS